MQITLNLPEALMQHFSPERINQEILEALAIQAYRAEKISAAQVGYILNLPSRWAVDAFLKESKVDLHYDENDLESDRQTLEQIRTKLKKP